MSRRKVLLRSVNSEASAIDLSFLALRENDTIASTPVYVDTQLRRKYTYVFANSMLGLVLMLVELQVAWDGHRLVHKPGGTGLRTLISVLSAFLVIQLADYYRLLLGKLTKDWQTKRGVEVLGFHISVWTVLRSSKVTPLFWSEALLVVLHAPPFPKVDDKWGLLMILRLYMFFRLIRDHSHVYQHRFDIARKTVYRNTLPPKFDWLLTVKSVASEWPVLSLCVATTVSLVTCGYIVYIFEREVNAAMFTFWVGIYLAFISMVTGWPTDTYDEYKPSTVIGRASCVVACMLGLMLLSWLIEAVSTQMALTPHQRPAVSWVSNYKIKQKLSDAAARVIQLVWLRHRAVGTLDKELSVPFLQAITEFRKIRRARNAFRAHLATNTRSIMDNNNNNLVLHVALVSLENRIASLESTLNAIVNKLDELSDKGGIKKM